MGVKTRIIPVILYDDHGAVKGKGFNSGRRIGAVIDRIRVMERRDIDELFLLDIAATPNNRGPRFDLIAEWCSNLFCPVTVGGGVRNVEDIRRLLQSGADKVAINTAILERPGLIDKAAGKFGAQCVVASIDVRGRHVVSHCGNRGTARCATAWAVECEQRGAGEILLTSVERDGSLEGYDLDLIRDVATAVDVPVVACGGCGSYDDVAAALSSGAHAAAVGAAFQYRDMTPKGACRYLHERGFSVRL